ncbi:hypothetical protein L227DRAFT_246727 [Lentinus tigrinus ALCF2SS1-6]|uniref:Uncharacterized protein n=1 Tax=Lentinus tigrinus ALCF2SS1-6 TaxID=1328759 RepID=A0A5C2S253_9APHY|nr:hypothetical protein L227DRAFT_246727 [Lentinus tigrinus ALCF2SS1-6]
MPSERQFLGARRHNAQHIACLRSMGIPARNCPHYVRLLPKEHPEGSPAAPQLCARGFDSAACVIMLSPRSTVSPMYIYSPSHAGDKVDGT